jgi:hypothetical protein
MKTRPDPGLVAASLGLLGLALVILLLSAIIARSAWDKVAQEWEPYRLNESQKNWFKSVRPKHAGPACCDIADGHPTQQDRRADGYYIPNPFHTDWDWVRVPDDAFTVPGSNPVGVATVWYGAQNPDGTPYIRCFVPESET